MSILLGSTRLNELVGKAVPCKLCSKLFGDKLRTVICSDKNSGLFFVYILLHLDCEQDPQPVRLLHHSSSYIEYPIQEHT